MLANGVNASEVTAATLVVAATTAVVAGAETAEQCADALLLSACQQRAVRESR